MTSIWYRCITHLSLPNAEWDKIGLERRRTCTRSLRKELEMDGRVAHKEAHHVAQERVQGRGRRIVRDPSPLALSGHSGFKIKGRWDWGQTLPCGFRELYEGNAWRDQNLSNTKRFVIPSFCYPVTYHDISLNCSWQKQHVNVGWHEGDLCASERRHPPARWHFPEAVSLQLSSEPPQPLRKPLEIPEALSQRCTSADTHLQMQI